MPETREFTGERFLPECTGEIWAEHWHRYLFASGFVRGLDVLDIACGEGYGSSLLGRHAKSVQGVDIDQATVDNARSRYGAGNIRFSTGSVSAIPYPDATFDCVVSFETLEHVAEQEEMLGELKRVLRPSGFVIVSTPNRIEYSDKRGFNNEFHVRELDGPEFRALIGRHFAAQRWHGQRLLFNSGLWPLDRSQREASSTTAAEWVTVDAGAATLPEPMYFIAFAAGSSDKLPDAADRTTLLADPEDSIYREYESTVSRTRSLEQHLADRERIVIERDAQIAALDVLKRDAEATIVERDAQIAALDAQKQKAEALLAERERIVIERDDQIARLDAQKREAESLLADRERIVIERDRMLDAVNARIAAAERLIADRERVVVERDRELAAVNERVGAVEALIDQRDRELAAVNARLRDAEKLIADRERIIVERDAQIVNLDQQKQTAEALIADRERIVVERDQQLIATNDRIARMESLIVERDNLLAATNERMSLAERVIAERDAAIAAFQQRSAELERNLQLATQRSDDLHARVAGLEAANTDLRTEVLRRASWRWWLSLPLRRILGKGRSTIGPDTER